MSHHHSLTIALIMLFGGWLWHAWPELVGLSALPDFVLVMLVYLAAHLLRMLRLGLLTLDQRNSLWPMAAAHALTAFPSSFLPFKLGEILRLLAFFRVLPNRQKAVAVWLAERLGDLMVLSIIILGLYLFDFPLPPALHAVLLLFVSISMFSLFTLLSLSRLCHYLNRYLVLGSHSKHGFYLLRASHALLLLERALRQSLDGRIGGFLLLTMLIWTAEITALGLFLRHAANPGGEFSSLFLDSLLASLPLAGQYVPAFGQYQLLALGLLCMVSILLSRQVLSYNLQKAHHGA